MCHLYVFQMSCLWVLQKAVWNRKCTTSGPTFWLVLQIAVCFQHVFWTSVIPLFVLFLPYSSVLLSCKSGVWHTVQQLWPHECYELPYESLVLLHETEWLSPLLPAVRKVSHGTDWGHNCCTRLGPHFHYEIGNVTKVYNFGAYFNCLSLPTVVLQVVFHIRKLCTYPYLHFCVSHFSSSVMSHFVVVSHYCRCALLPLSNSVLS